MPKALSSSMKSEVSLVNFLKSNDQSFIFFRTLIFFLYYVKLDALRKVQEKLSNLQQELANKACEAQEMRTELLQLKVSTLTHYHLDIHLFLVGYQT